jgi:glutamate formiminotransferase
LEIANQKSKIDKLVECVPNFSEGRKLDTVERLVQTIESATRPQSPPPSPCSPLSPGAVVLDQHMDADHNRSVITFVAGPGLVVEAALRAVATALELIDLRQHTGQHPRIGATDVLPFVPVRDVTMEEAVALAHEAGERIWRELSIPVYFYQRAALRPNRVNLAEVRRRGFEQLGEEITHLPERAPDIGDARVHDSAGAIAVGARPLLIAFNVNLRTRDIAIARGIARTVRARDGGLRGVKALGFELGSRGLVQVSMNLDDYEETGIAQAYEAVRSAAEGLGVEVASTEIVGLVPRAALDRDAPYFSQLEHFSEDSILENRLETAKTPRAPGN